MIIRSQYILHGWIFLVFSIIFFPVAGEWLARSVSPIIAYTAATWPSNGTAIAVGSNVIVFQHFQS